MELTSRYFQGHGGIRLHAMTAGPANGRPIVLLHGFPEFWYSWRKQIPALAAAGNFVVALDQRGYNLSDKPANISDYRVDKLAADVLALREQLGVEKLRVVGHDWGAVVTWYLAIAHPEHVERVAVINVPHPIVFKKYLKTHPTQMLKSWYMFFFQLPKLPEKFVSRGDFGRSSRALTGTSLPGTFTEEDIARYKEAWRQPGAPTGMINWYRAAFQTKPPELKSIRVTVPLLMLWGAQDKFLEAAAAKKSLEMCDQAKLEMFYECTHWVHEEAHQRVSDFLTEFFA